MFPFSRTLLNFFFPPFCVGCGKNGTWLCQSCLDEIPHLANEPERVHLVPYSNPTARKLVTNLKYKSASCLIEPMRMLISRHQKPDWAAETVIVSVPASQKRFRERGIDQAALIADILKETWFPNAKRALLLKRVKHTLPNAKLADVRARQGNISGAFEATGQVSGTIILVDDVYTSGATMNECVRILKEAGAKEVKLFTIAKG